MFLSLAPVLSQCLVYLDHIERILGAPLLLDSLTLAPRSRPSLNVKVLTSDWLTDFVHLTPTCCWPVVGRHAGEMNEAVTSLGFLSCRASLETA